MRRKSPKKKSEAEVKTDIGNWLSEHGCAVYDERKSSRWNGTFRVQNVYRGKRPDLIIGCHLNVPRMPVSEEKIEKLDVDYVALEIKPGYNHLKIAEGFLQVLGYFADYCWGATYQIKPNEGHYITVNIAVFALATNFSSQGYIYEGEEKFSHKTIKETNLKREFYPITFSLSRLLGRQKTEIINNIMDLNKIPDVGKRVDNHIRPWGQDPEVGILTKFLKNSGQVNLLTSKSPFYYRVDRLAPWDIGGENK